MLCCWGGSSASPPRHTRHHRPTRTATRRRHPSFQVENLDVLDDNQVKFDFLGKDSIRYENVVKVHPKVTGQGRG